LKPTNSSWRVDETYVRVKGKWTYLYRAVDSAGATIVELFKLGEEQPPRLGIRCADVLSGFYSFLGYTRLTSKEVIQKAVARGIQQGVFGYFAGIVPTLDAGCRYKVARNKVRFDVSVADDEVDLDSGFIMLPQAIPAEPVPQPGPGPGPVPPGPVPPGPTPPPGASAHTSTHR
jgi:hypothetical protein